MVCESVVQFDSIYESNSRRVRFSIQFINKLCSSEAKCCAAVAVACVSALSWTRNWN